MERKKEYVGNPSVLAKYPFERRYGGEKRGFLRPDDKDNSRIA